MFGYTRDELVGEVIEALLPERDLQRHVAHRETYAHDPRLRQTGVGLELHGRRKDGSEFPVEISLSPRHSGGDLHVVAIIRDVTDRVRANIELERLRRQQELLLSSVTEGILGIDDHGVITFANPSAARLLGYRVEDLVGQAEHGLLHSKRPDGSAYPVDRCPIHRSLGEGSTHHAAGETFTRRGGDTLPVEYTSAPIREGSRIVGASVIFVDVSDRKRSEEAVRAATRRLMAAYETIPDAFLALDKDFRVVYMNPAAERMEGASRREDIVGKILWEKQPELLGTRYEKEFRRAMRERVAVSMEEFYQPLRRWYETNVYPTEDGLSVYYRDVTDRKASQAAHREASLARPLARRIVQDLVEQGNVPHPVLIQVGRKLASETPGDKLEDHLAAYREMGLGTVEVEKKDAGRYTFVGDDLLERRGESRVATCSFTLGYLSEAVSRVHASEPTLGTEIECQSRGAPRCRFIIQVKKPEEGLARRVKELI